MILIFYLILSIICICIIIIIIIQLLIFRNSLLDTALDLICP